MDQKERIRSELAALRGQAGALVQLIRKNEKQFYSGYQDWYTKAVEVVRVLATDRLLEFRSYYEGDLSVSSYCIRDFVRGLRPRQDPFEALRGGVTFNANEVTIGLFMTQTLILAALVSRIEGVVAELESLIAHGIQDAEIDSAERLKKVNLRAAGALAGVVLETHLQRVASAHQIAVRKNPTIGDLNEPLKKAGVYDTPEYRKIQHIADIRNICTHQKGKDPTPEQVDDMLNGVRSITRSVF
jgi:hypothetical protein